MPSELIDNQIFIISINNRKNSRFQQLFPSPGPRVSIKWRCSGLTQLKTLSNAEKSLISLIIAWQESSICQWKERNWFKNH